MSLPESIKGSSKGGFRQGDSNFEQVQSLKEQNMQLKGKMARLNLALDRAMTNGNGQNNTASQQPNSDLNEGLEQIVTHQN